MTLGIYGKLPARGDFIQRNMPPDCLQAWDDWLQQGLVCSREQLGADWLRYYLNGPLWRFALSAGCCGQPPVTGVWMPSVDRVGRYFPLTVISPIATDADLLALVRGEQAWFERVEQVLLTGLADHLDLDGFLEQVQAVGPPPHAQIAVSSTGTGQNWHYVLPELAALDRAIPQLWSVLLAQLLPNTTLWWTHGSQDIAACVLLCAGLPDSTQFATLLTGDSSDHHWTRVEINQVG